MSFFFHHDDRGWKVDPSRVPSDMEQRVIAYMKKGGLVPHRSLILNQEQIEGIRQSGVINSGLLDEVGKFIREGISTEQIDQLVCNYTRDHGAIAADLGYEGFPKSVCTSINNVVCHGIPSPFEILKAGDIVNVDVTTIFNGYYADASRMFVVGGSTQPQWQRLVDVSKECLLAGLKAVRPYGYVGDIGFAIQSLAEKNGYSVVRELCGHGVGLKFHDEPHVLHYGKKGDGMLLVPGMVFTIEPMINMGRRNIYIDKNDKWTIRTVDGLPSAQWEYTVLLTPDGTEVLSH